MKPTTRLIFTAVKHEDPSIKQVVSGIRFQLGASVNARVGDVLTLWADGQITITRSLNPVDYEQSLNPDLFGDLNALAYKHFYGDAMPPDAPSSAIGIPPENPETVVEVTTETRGGGKGKVHSGGTQK